MVGAFEIDHEGVVIGRLGAKLADIGLAVSDLFGVLDRVHRRDVLGERIRVEHTGPGVDEIVCVERRAVRPGHALADVECELGRVRVDVPALGHARDDFAGLLIDADQPVEDVEEHVQLSVVAVADAGVHGGWLGVRQAHGLIGGELTGKRRDRGRLIDRCRGFRCRSLRCRLGAGQHRVTESRDRREGARGQEPLGETAAVELPLGERLAERRSVGVIRHARFSPGGARHRISGQTNAVCGPAISDDKFWRTQSDRGANPAA